MRFTAPDDAHAARVEQLLTEAFGRVGDTDDGEPAVRFDQWDRSVPPHDSAGDSDVREVGPGLFTAGPATARLTRALDELFQATATDAGAVDYAVPHLVSGATLERAGYPRSFPQHLTACGTVGPDLQALDRFAAASGPEGRQAELQVQDVYLAPAVCLHVFAMLADTTVTSPQLVTARGVCGRYEAGAGWSRQRRWSFSMREIVFVGRPGEAEEFRETMVDTLAALASDLGLPCRVVAANDPFFTRDRPQMTRYQRAFEVKHELVARMAGGCDEPVAVASVNLHQQHFGDGFGIALPGGSPAHSVCVGFGLERWAEWVGGYLGGDPERWPPLLRYR